MEVTFTTNFIVMAAGVLISALATYVPKFNTWFAMKSDEAKQLTMLILMFVVSAVIFGLGCFGFITIDGFACNKQTVFDFGYMFFMAAISNQSADRILPKPIAVRQARDIVQTDELAKKFL